MRLISYLKYDLQHHQGIGEHEGTRSNYIVILQAKSATVSNGGRSVHCNERNHMHRTSFLQFGLTAYSRSPFITASIAYGTNVAKSTAGLHDGGNENARRGRGWAEPEMWVAGTSHLFWLFVASGYWLLGGFLSSEVASSFSLSSCKAHWFVDGMATH